eukprot:gene7987-16342_t
MSNLDDVFRRDKNPHLIISELKTWISKNTQLHTNQLRDYVQKLLIKDNNIKPKYAFTLFCSCFDALVKVSAAPLDGENVDSWYKILTKFLTICSKVELSDKCKISIAKAIEKCEEMDIFTPTATWRQMIQYEPYRSSTDTPNTNNQSDVFRSCLVFQAICKKLMPPKDIEMRVYRHIQGYCRSHEVPSGDVAVFVLAVILLVSKQDDNDNDDNGPQTSPYPDNNNNHSNNDYHDDNDNGYTEGYSSQSSSQRGSYTTTTSSGITSTGTDLMVVDQKGALLSSSSSQPTRPLWRKREVVRQERTVHYTTLDAQGVVQELVEKETTQTEVLHMECRETGEFAHRETSTYEQTELFNNEVVAEEQGTEEYVHLKSLQDEFEYMDSTMPRKNPVPPPDTTTTDPDTDTDPDSNPIPDQQQRDHDNDGNIDYDEEHHHHQQQTHDGDDNDHDNDNEHGYQGQGKGTTSTGSNTKGGGGKTRGTPRPMSGGGRGGGRGGGAGRHFEFNDEEDEDDEEAAVQEGKYGIGVGGVKAANTHGYIHANEEEDDVNSDPNPKPNKKQGNRVHYFSEYPPVKEYETSSATSPSSSSPFTFHLPGYRNKHHNDDSSAGNDNGTGDELDTSLFRDQSGLSIPYVHSPDVTAGGIAVAEGFSFRDSDSSLLDGDGDSKDDVRANMTDRWKVNYGDDDDEWKCPTTTAYNDSNSHNHNDLFDDPLEATSRQSARVSNKRDHNNDKNNVHDLEDDKDISNNKDDVPSPLLSDGTKGYSATIVDID